MPSSAKVAKDRCQRIGITCCAPTANVAGTAMSLASAKSVFASPILSLILGEKVNEHYQKTWTDLLPTDDRCSSANVCDILHGILAVDRFVLLYCLWSLR